MNMIERKHKTLELLKERKFMSVAELSQLLNVSAVTIRGDLNDLERKGLVVRTHGGVCIAESYPTLRFIDDTLSEMQAEKESIALMAASLIKKHHSIIIDSGSTTAFLARKIKQMNLTVITNSIMVVQELINSDSIELLVSGGGVRKPSMALIGTESNAFFDHINANIYCMGASGFSVTHGISCTNMHEAETKRHMLKRTLTTCLLIDSSKYNRVYMASICDWDDIDYLITDKINDTVRKQLEERGVEVITPDGQSSI